MDLGFIFPRRSNHLLRLATLGVAIGLAVMGVNAGVAHFAGRPVKSVAQLVPVLFGQLACGVLVLGSLLRWADQSLRKTLRVVGIFAIVVGVAGTLAHGIGMFQGLSGVELSLGVVLAAASPMVGSFAFIGMGALLIFLGNPQTSRELRESPARAAEDTEANEG